MALVTPAHSTAAKPCPMLGYTDLPIDARQIIMHFVIELTEGSYRTLIPALGALTALDREACGGVWRVAFEKAFGKIPGAGDDETNCPHLLGVHSWREALVRTWKALNAVPVNERWRWEHMPLWSLKGMDARLALLGTIPSGALADLMRARGASLLRYNMNIVNSRELCEVIGRIGNGYSNETALLANALALIEGGANAGYSTEAHGHYPALHRAAMGTSVRALKLLLFNGARMLLQHAAGTGGDEAGHKRTPLMIAKDPEMVSALLCEGADPNHYVDSLHGHVTPLMVAARERSVDVARLLLRAGADPRVRNSRALEEARKYEDEAPEMAELIERYM